ncbi:MAG: phage tail tape measure protein [Armatimonadetes bacterium]|nr:phage tail tape measure protein [Armatimonadota bacterium]
MALASQLGMMFTAKDLASAEIRKVDKSLKDVANTSDAVAAAYEMNMARIRKGAAMMAVAVVGLLGMVKVTRTFGEFQHTLASAGVIMGATTSEMRSLEKAAIDAGIATQFSPREAAEGLQSLGAAGMNAQQAITALNPVLDLAAASLGQLGVAGAAENVVGVLNAFSMQADKARDVADKLTRITQLTNFQFRDMSVAISQSASQASSADQTFESMLATLGMLRNANVHASVAATSYREAVRRLAGDEGAQKQLRKLSVEVLDQQTKKIRDLGSIMAEIAPKLEVMNSKEKNLTLTRIFGVRGMKVYSSFVSQYNKLVKDGVVATGDFAGAHRRLVTELDNASGAAVKNRDALLQTAEGQRQLLKGSWETTQIMLGKLAIPAILPALQALTNMLNVFIQVINVIPAPMREMMGMFAGTFLAFRALRGATMMLSGALGLLQLRKVASGVTEVGDAASSAATNVGKAGIAAGGGIRGAFARASGAISGMLGPISIAVSGFMAVYSYIRKSEQEEIQRQKEIRQQNVATMQSYMRALDMAKALRNETAKAMADQLNANAKTEKGARKVLEKFRSSFLEVTKQVEEAERKYIKFARTFGTTHAETRKARAEFVRLQGKHDAVTRAMIASEAAVARFEVKRAKGIDKEMLGRKVIAERLISEQVQRRNIARMEAERDLRLKGLTGKTRAWEKERADRDIRREKRRTDAHLKETARLAVRFGIEKKELLHEQGRARVRERLRTAAGGAMIAPLREMRLPSGYQGWLQRGELPPEYRTAEGLKRLQGILARRKELGLQSFPEAEAMLPVWQRRVERGMAPEVPKEAVAGITLPSIGLGVAPGEGPMGLRPEREAPTMFAGLAEAIRAMPEELRRGQAPVVTHVYFDSEKVATVIASHQERTERDKDGSGAVTARTGVKGAG